jgi:hypothetical protein
MNDWSRVSGAEDRRQGGSLWDDKATNSGDGGSGMLDLADFAAAALKFQNETQGLTGAGDDYVREEDGLSRIINEQVALDGNDDEDEDLPEWADEGDEVGPSSLARVPEVIVSRSSSSSSKRNLLLEVPFLGCVVCSVVRDNFLLYAVSFSVGLARLIPSGVK